MAEIESKMRTLLSEADSGGSGWRERLDKAMALVAQAWDESAEEAHALGWLHKEALADVLGRNPYRTSPPGEST